jgi:hypothetical protein
MIQQTTRNNAMYGVPREVERMWVMKVAIMPVRGCKQQTRAGWRWASLTGECGSPNSRQRGRRLAFTASSIRFLEASVSTQDSTSGN